MKKPESSQRTPSLGKELAEKERKRHRSSISGERERGGKLTGRPRRGQKSPARFVQAPGLAAAMAAAWCLQAQEVKVASPRAQRRMLESNFPTAPIHGHRRASAQLPCFFLRVLQTRRDERLPASWWLTDFARSTGERFGSGRRTGQSAAQLRGVSADSSGVRDGAEEENEDMECNKEIADMCINI